MKFQLNHMCSNVRDMDKNIAFYTNVLGGQVTSYQIIEPSNAKYVYVQVGDQLIELIEPGEHKEDTAYGLTHIAYETEDLDAAYEYLTGLGYNFHVKPKAAASGNGRLAFFRDPNGVVVEILQRDTTMYREPIESPVVCAFDHYAVISHDLKAAHKLYHEHLGMGNLAHFVVGDNVREIMYLDHGASVLEIVQSDVYRKEDNPHSHLAFRVKDFAKTCEELAKHGIILPEENLKTPGIQVGLSASITDPEGIRIELLNRVDLHEFEELGYTPDTLSAMREF